MTEPATRGEGVAEAVAHPDPITTPGGRQVAPGGWKRAVTGLVVGAGAGIVHRLARARDERARRRRAGHRDPGRGS